jgi:hypothetical protein
MIRCTNIRCTHAVAEGVTMVWSAPHEKGSKLTLMECPQLWKMIESVNFQPLFRQRWATLT